MHQCFAKASKLLIVYSFNVLDEEPKGCAFSRLPTRMQAKGICTTFCRAISRLYERVGNAFLKDTDSLQYPSLATVFAIKSIAMHSEHG